MKDEVQREMGSNLPADEPDEGQDDLLDDPMDIPEPEPVAPDEGVKESGDPKNPEKGPEFFRNPEGGPLVTEDPGPQDSEASDDAKASENSEA